MPTSPQGFVPNPIGLAELLRSPAGPVYRDLLVRGERVKRRMYQTCPVGKEDPLGRSRPDGTQPGNMRNHINKRVEVSGTNLTVHIGVWDVPYALGVVRGNPPHVINGNPLLVFYWPKAGGVVAFRHVNHPGNRPNNFMLKALSAAA